MNKLSSVCSISRLTSGEIIVRNILYNFIGQGTPLVLAIFAVPILINKLGTERFGVLALAWMVIGYFSLFDLGLGRALTKLVADKLGANQKEEIPALVWTSLFSMLGLGIVGALVIVLISPWLTNRVLNIPLALQPESLNTFYLLSFCIPFVIISTGLRGVLEAFQWFQFINTVRISLGMATFLSPLIVLPFSQNIFHIVAVLTIFRILACIVYLSYTLHVLPLLRQKIVIQHTIFKPLFRFGCWITISNIVSPVMEYLDRFLIGAVVSMTAVAYYVTPYEVVTKLGIISGALIQVLFPSFATSFVRDSRRTALLFGRGVKFIFLILFPITLLILSAAQDGLEIWLGKEFAVHSTLVLQFLALGVFINSLARVPYALIQSLGKPNLTALVHLIELPFYLFAVLWMTRTYGILGTAIVWLARIIIDTMFMFGIGGWLLPYCKPVIWRMALITMVGLLALICTILPIGFIMNKILVFTILGMYAFVAWFVVLNSNERRMILDSLKSGLAFKWKAWMS